LRLEPRRLAWIVAVEEQILDDFRLKFSATPFDYAEAFFTVFTHHWTSLRWG
jgi:hypothetical protein